MEVDLTSNELAIIYALVDEYVEMAEKAGAVSNNRTLMREKIANALIKAKEQDGANCVQPE